MKIQEAYKQKMSAQLKEWNAQINLLEAKIENAGADMKVKSTDVLKELKIKQHAAAEKMKELEKASDPVARKAELVAEYRAKFANTFVAAERGYVDDVIEPHETRARLINALEMLQNKRDANPAKKHGNIPL